MENWHDRFVIVSYLTGLKLYLLVQKFSPLVANVKIWIHLNITQKTNLHLFFLQQVQKISCRICLYLTKYEVHSNNQKGFSITLIYFVLWYIDSSNFSRAKHKIVIRSFISEREMTGLVQSARRQCQNMNTSEHHKNENRNSKYS